MKVFEIEENISPSRRFQKVIFLQDFMHVIPVDAMSHLLTFPIISQRKKVISIKLLGKISLRFVSGIITGTLSMN